ncbi:MAG: OB-fold nucleic acid binding domain-containing protein [Pirellulales bacterium]
MFDLEDMDGIMRCILWPSDFANFGHLAIAESIVAIRGAVDRRPGSEEANLIVNEIIPIAELPQRFTKGIRVRIDEGLHGEKGIDAVAEILRGYPGACEVEVLLQLLDGCRVQLKSESLKVELQPELRRRLDELLGPGNIRFLAAPPRPSNNGGERKFQRGGFQRQGAGA